MAEEQDFEQEEFETSEHEQGSEQDSYVSKQDFENMKAQLEAMQSKLYKQNQQQTKPAGLSKEQLAEIAKDPALLGQYTQAQLDSYKKEIRMESEKVKYDKQAEEFLPQMKTDKQVQQRVAQKMKELVEVTGEYTYDSPTVLLRAAQLVAPEISRGGSMNNNSNEDEGSGLDVQRSNRMTTHSSKKRTKIEDSDPRLRFAQAFGYSGKKLEEFKQTLGPYVPTRKKNGRSLMS